MTFGEWESSVPVVIRSDTLWKVKAYRLGMFLGDLGRSDAKKLWKHVLTREHADQVVRATARVGPNISEGYSRNTGKERARYYEYAIGSTREARDWYFQSRDVLGEKVTAHRLELCSEILRLTLTMTNQQRRTNRRLDPD